VAEILPGPARLGLEGAVATSYAARVAGMLRTLGYAASRQHDNLELAMLCFSSALELPCSDELRHQLETQRYALYQEHLAKKDHELVLETNGATFKIDARGIALNDEWTSPADVTGLRHGVMEEAVDDGVVTRHVVVWNSASGEFSLDPAQFSADGNGAGEYQQIIEALHFFLAPALAERLAGAVKRGETVMLGDSPMNADGVLLDASRIFWKRAQLVPYSQLQHVLSGQTLTLSSLENPKLSQSYDIARTWNAVIIGRVIDDLAGR
jgi:hypothetical protein